MGMPSSSTWVCSLRKPRVKTEVSCPAVAGLHDGKPGNFAQRIGHALDLFFFEILRSHDAHAGRGLIERNVGPSSSDDDWL